MHRRRCFRFIRRRESSSAAREKRGKLRESAGDARIKRGIDLISRPDVGFVDHRLTDNPTIITSRSLSLALLLRIFASPSPPYNLPPLFFFSRYRIVGRSIYISVFLPLFADKRVSMATLSSERGTNRVSVRSTYLSPGSLSSSLYVSLHLSRFPYTHDSVSVSVRLISLPLTHSRRLVRWSAAIMTPRGGEYAPHQDRLH